MDMQKFNYGSCFKRFENIWKRQWQSIQCGACALNHYCLIFSFGCNDGQKCLLNCESMKCSSLEHKTHTSPTVISFSILIRRGNRDRRDAYACSPTFRLILQTMMNKTTVHLSNGRETKIKNIRLHFLFEKIHLSNKNHCRKNSCK